MTPRHRFLNETNQMRTLNRGQFRNPIKMMSTFVFLKEDGLRNGIEMVSTFVFLVTSE